MNDFIRKNADKILSWKREYNEIYHLKIKENIYIFRTLTRGEYKDFLSLQDKIGDDTQDFLLDTCLLSPEYNKDEINNTLAGEIEYLSYSIINLSGFSKKESIINDLEKVRQEVAILDSQVSLLICKAFPHLTPDDIDKFNYNKLLRYLAFSEAILDTKLVIEQEENQQTINFEKDNKKILGKGVSQGMRVPPNIPRGDVG